MDVDKLYESLAEIPVAELSGWQDAFMKFYRAWFYEDRWKSYFEGLVTTIEVTVIALAIGVVLGLLVTMIGALSLGINSGAYVAEIIRGGLMSLDVGQTEAGRSLGLGYIDTMRFIVIPQAFKAILPALGNEFIVLLKDTSLISAISGKEILYFAKAISSRTYEYMFPLYITALMYLIMVMIFSALQSKLERRLRQSDRR